MELTFKLCDEQDLMELISISRSTYFHSFIAQNTPENTPAKMPAHERLVSIYEQLNELLLLHQPELCAVEKLFFSRNVTTAIAVGQARGVVMLGLAQAGMEPAEYTPNEIKLAVAGYGGARKRQMQEMVRMLLELDSIPRPDDAADALAVAITHIHSARMLSLSNY